MFKIVSLILIGALSFLKTTSIANGIKFFFRKNSYLSKAVPLAYSAHYKNISLSGHSSVVILHGLLGSKSNWNSLSKLINERTGLKVYALDHRNHGESPHTKEMNYDLLANDIELFLRNNNINKVKLVGHSLGGRAAIKYAFQFPEKVEDLVVVDVSHVKRRATLSEIPDILRALSELDLTRTKNLPEARSLADKALVPVCPSKPVRQFLCTNLYKDSNNVIKWRFNLATLKETFPESLISYPQPVTEIFNGPTTFIAGENSDYILPEDHNKILKNFPKANIHYIPGAGHFVHSEKPFEFLDILIPAIQQE